MNRMMVSPSSSLELDYCWLILSPLLRIHAYSAPPTMSSRESLSVMSDSLWPRGLYSPWNPLGQNSGVGSLSLLLGIFPNPEIEPRSPALQADSLPAKSQGKPKNTRMGSLSLLQQIFSTQESNQGLLHCRQILYQLSYQGIGESSDEYVCVCVCRWVISDSLGPCGL